MKVLRWLYRGFMHDKKRAFYHMIPALIMLLAAVMEGNKGAVIVALVFLLHSFHSAGHIGNLEEIVDDSIGALNFYRKAELDKKQSAGSSGCSP